MIIKVTKSKLFECVTNMSMAINPKPVLPVLSTIMFSVTDGKVVVNSSDQELQIKSELEVLEIGGDPINFCVDAARIKNAISNIPEQPLTLDVSNTELICKYKGGKFKIPLNDTYPDMFPAFPEIGEEYCTSIVDSHLLCKATASCSKFASSDPLRPVLCGVLLNFTQDGTDIVSTNGHALVKIEVPFKSSAKESVVVSTRAIGIIKKMFDCNGYQTTFYINRTNAFINCRNTTIVTRRIDGKFPNYNAVIPQNNSVYAEFSPSDMAAAIKRVSVMGDETGSIKMTIGNGKVEVDAVNLDFSTSAHEEVNATGDGEVKAGYKAEFMQNVLSLLSDNCKMELIDASHACKFVQKDKDYTITAVVMPVLIN